MYLKLTCFIRIQEVISGSSIGRSLSTIENGDAPVDWLITGTNSEMYNDPITLKLVFDDVVIDIAELPNDISGVSASLDPAEHSATGNDVPTAFCAATTTDIFEGFGTPGQPNDSCL